MSDSATVDTISGFNPAVTTEIRKALSDVCATDRVSIPLAIESGSRAWGFPSPDSDYDCRFIFIRQIDDYLSPWQRRDVIELPLAGELDVNGWDLGKALKLLLKGNAVIIEWLTSPVHYSVEPDFRDEFLTLAHEVTDHALIGRHYLHLGERQRRTYFGDSTAVQQKKIFYALRPAAALRWLRIHPDEPVPPMHFPTLMAECDPPRDIAEIVADLITKKAVTRELGTQPLPPSIGAFIDREFDAARDLFETAVPCPLPERRRRAEHFFVEQVRKFSS
ncbi:hypothetical protein FHS85_003175 [Rhodoligotrophos appendicifer]|uniref:nucleotidyltransferase domain-containing protein n=1 Tax=Rhodoligotrophos appendicifer TaxID=987056 RepID=UPI0011860C0F|nr:nucleotidyltransferase domain-containing protein [Rhodoligotrophos appendicifer]